MNREETEEVAETSGIVVVSFVEAFQEEFKQQEIQPWPDCVYIPLDGPRDLDEFLRWLGDQRTDNQVLERNLMNAETPMQSMISTPVQPTVIHRDEAANPATAQDIENLVRDRTDECLTGLSELFTFAALLLVRGSSVMKEFFRDIPMLSLSNPVIIDGESMRLELTLTLVNDRYVYDLQFVSSDSALPESFVLLLA